MANTGDNFDDNACDGTDTLNYGSSNSNNKLSDNNYDPLIWKPVFNINTTNSNSPANSSPQIMKNSSLLDNKTSGQSSTATLSTNNKSFLPHLSSIVDYSSNSNESVQPNVATTKINTETTNNNNEQVLLINNNSAQLENAALNLNESNENKDSSSIKHKKKKKNKDKSLKSKDKDKERDKQDKDKEKKHHHHHHKASHHHKKKDKEKNRSTQDQNQLDASTTANSLSPSSSSKKKDKKLLKKLKKEQKRVEKSANLEGASNAPNDLSQVSKFFYFLNF